MDRKFGAQSTTEEVLAGIDLSGRRVLVTGVSAGLGVETVHHDVEVGVDLHLDFVALAFGSEFPCRIEVFLPHEPIHRDAYDRFVVDDRFPVEFAARDLARLDDADDRSRRQEAHHPRPRRHDVGRVALGEPSVIVAASSGHRPEAFLGAREVIDEVKAKAAIWKAEEGEWVEGTVPEA